MTSDMWTELEAQVEAHGPNSIIFELVDSDGVRLIIEDIKWEDESIKVMMDAQQPN